MKIYFCGSNFFQQFSEIPQICPKLTQVLEDFDLKDVFNSHFLTIYFTSKGHVLLSGYYQDAYCTRRFLDTLPIVKSLSLCETFALFVTETNSVLKLDLNNTWNVREIPNFLSVETSFDDNQEKKDLLDRINAIKCSDCLTIAISDFGHVYNVPNKITTEKLDIKDFAVGREHCLILLNDGTILSFGNSKFGQLGHGDLDEHEKPKLIEALTGIKITEISAGYWHSVALSDQGDVYSWGYNNCGQLGHSKNISQVQPTPKVIDIDTNDNNDVFVRNISCGAKHTLVLLDNGQLFGCGCNKYSQLGIKIDLDIIIDKMQFICDFSYLNDSDIRLKCGQFSSMILIK